MRPTHRIRCNWFILIYVSKHFLHSMLNKFNLRLYCWWCCIEPVLKIVRNRFYSIFFLLTNYLFSIFCSSPVSFLFSTKETECAGSNTGKPILTYNMRKFGKGIKIKCHNRNKSITDNDHNTIRFRIIFIDIKWTTNIILMSNTK